VSTALCPFLEALHERIHFLPFELVAEISSLHLQDRDPHFLAGCQLRSVPRFYKLDHGPLSPSSKPAIVGQPISHFKSLLPVLPIVSVFLPPLTSFVKDTCAYTGSTQIQMLQNNLFILRFITLIPSQSSFWHVK